MRFHIKDRLLPVQLKEKFKIYQGLRTENNMKKFIQKDRGFEYDRTEWITYKEVLRHLKEITNRLKSIKNSSLNRRTQTNSWYFTKREDNERLKLDQKLDRPKDCKNY